MKILFMLASCLLANCSFAAGIAESSGKSPALPSRQRILDCLKNFTALDAFLTVENTERVSLSEVNIPFLTPGIKGQMGIRVRFAPGKIKWDSRDHNVDDPNLWRFTVYLDAQATRVLAVASRLAESSSEMYPVPSPEAAANELRNESEVYTSFPKVGPNYTFMFALETARAHGPGNPNRAQEIDGFYIMDSRMGEKPHPVWIVNMHGLPPGQIIGPFTPGPIVQGPPASRRYYTRDIVDAIVGGLIMSSSGPEPE